MIRVHRYGYITSGIIQVEIEDYDARTREGVLLDSLDLNCLYRRNGMDGAFFAQFQMVVSGLRSGIGIEVTRGYNGSEWFEVYGTGVKGAAKKRRFDFDDTILAAWRADRRNREQRDKEDYESLMRGEWG